MKYILSILSVLVMASGLTMTTAQQAEAGSRKNAIIAGAILGGAIAAGAASRHHRRHDRGYYVRDRDRDDYDDRDYGYEPARDRRCHRVRRCYWKPARKKWRNGRSYYRAGYESCRRVRVCR